MSLHEETQETLCLWISRCTLTLSLCLLLNQFLPQPFSSSFTPLLILQSFPVRNLHIAAFPCQPFSATDYVSIVWPIIIIIIIINPLTTKVDFPVLHCPLGLAKLQAWPFPNVVFPPLPLSTLSSFFFHGALQDGFGQTWWMGNMTIPLQFASLYDHQETFVWSNCLQGLGTDFLVGNMVFVWDV